MKKFFFLSLTALLGLTFVSCDKIIDQEDMGVSEWIDLGLSVKWCAHNNEAKKPYEGGTGCLSKDLGNNVPSKEQWEELVSNCTMKAAKYKDGLGGTRGILFTSKKNKKTMFLPYTSGGDSHIGKYWTSTAIDDNTAYIFVFDLDAKGGIETTFNPYEHNKILYCSCRCINSSY